MPSYPLVLAWARALWMQNWTWDLKTREHLKVQSIRIRNQNHEQTCNAIDKLTKTKQIIMSRISNLIPNVHTLLIPVASEFVMNSRTLLSWLWLENKTMASTNNAAKDWNCNATWNCNWLHVFLPASIGSWNIHEWLERWHFMYKCEVRWGIQVEST